MPDWRGAAEGIPAPDGRRASARSCAARHLADDAPGPCGSSSTKGSREVTVVPRPFSGPRYTGLARRCSALTRGPTDGHPRAQVDHRRQIQPSFTGAQIGDVSDESGPGHLPDAGRVRGGGTLSAVSTHPVPRGAFPHPDVVSDLLHRAARGQDNTHGIITESSRNHHGNRGRTPSYDEPVIRNGGPNQAVSQNHAAAVGIPRSIGAAHVP